jgi:hypothetical protein
MGTGHARYGLTMYPKICLKIFVMINDIAKNILDNLK